MCKVYLFLTSRLLFHNYAIFLERERHYLYSDRNVAATGVCGRGHAFEVGSEETIKRTNFPVGFSQPERAVVRSVYVC